MSSTLSVRPVTAGDVEFLWEMLYWAAHVDEDEGVEHADVRFDPDLLGHVAGWGRDGDLGVIAEVEGRGVGAAWLRLFDAGTSDFSVFVDEATPELAIAVAPARVGTGVGSSLLDALFEVADEMFETIVLSVRASNPAVALYERFGFRELDRKVNRVGTESLRMLRRRPEPPSG